MNALDVFAEARPDVEADDGVLSAIAAELFDGVPRRPGGSARWRVLAVAAAVVALVAGLAVIVGRPEQTAPADTVPPVIEDDGEPLRMLPSDLDGVTVVGFLSGRQESTDRSTVLARPMPDGSYTDKVIVRRGPVDDLLADVANFDDVEPLSVRGLVWDVASDVELGWVVAQSDLGDETALTVTVETTDDVERSQAIVVDVMKSLANVAQPPLGVAFDPLPAGFEVIAEWAVSNSWVRYASVHAADGSITKVITHANDDKSLAARLMGDDLRPVEVRGVAGFATTYLDTERVVWEESPGQWASVESATGATVDELLGFAESLRVVGPDEWDRVVGLPDEMAGTPATTAPAPQLGGVSPPATSAPQTAPAGRLLVANAAMVGGVAGQWSASFDRQGAEVLDPVNALPPGGEAAQDSRVYARPGFEPLAQWVADQFGGVVVEPFDALDAATVEGGVAGADVVAVVGRAHVDPALVEPPPPGSVLMASNIVGLGPLVGRPLAERGATLLPAAQIPTEGKPPIETTRVFARTSAAELGAWVAGQLGVADVEPMDRAAAVLGDPDRLIGEVLGEVGLDAADVIVVVGRDRAMVDARGAVPWVFGDSVTLGAEDALTVRGYVVDALVSRTFGEAVDQVETVLDTVQPNVVVLQIATNGPIKRSDLDRLLAATADVPNVILVNTHVEREWADPNNALLAEVDLPEDNLILMDWDALADQCPGVCFASDGIHLTDVGADYFADKLGEITGY